jgi:hypothetical protein
MAHTIWSAASGVAGRCASAGRDRELDRREEAGELGIDPARTRARGLPAALSSLGAATRICRNVV